MLCETRVWARELLRILMAVRRCTLPHRPLARMEIIKYTTVCASFATQINYNFPYYCSIRFILKVSAHVQLAS
ncbi:MAG: hypothetical protein ACI90V_006196 [Bacillariaceae sp.]|jgi:hypothetical protein